MRVFLLASALSLVACESLSKEADESCTNQTIDTHVQLSLLNPDGVGVDSFTGTATPEGEATVSFTCPEDPDCLPGAVQIWTAAARLDLDVQSADGALEAQQSVDLSYEEQFCGDDGHCAIQCPLATPTVTLVAAAG